MTKWTAADIKRLNEIVIANGGAGIAAFKKASKELNRSVASCEKRYSRGELSDYKTAPWSTLENRRLYALRHECKKSYHEIAEVLKRTPIACERQYQRGDWSDMPSDAEELVKYIQEAEEVEIVVEKEQEHEKEDKYNEFVVQWLVTAVHLDMDRLNVMTKDAFEAKLEKVLNCPDAKLAAKIKISDITIPFKEIKRLAAIEIHRLGWDYPKERSLGQGRFLVVGDSHGKHMSREMFDLLKVVNETLKPDKIIHNGDMSDEEDEISYLWNDLFKQKLIVVGAQSEWALLRSQKCQYDVVRESVKLGNKLVVTNQHEMGDYVKKSIGRVDTRTLPDFAILNTHRHEFYTHCGYKGRKMVASPGCMCERHINRTDKVLHYKMGGCPPRVRKTYLFGHKKYNKQMQDSKRWEQGILVVDVDKDGNATITPCRIYQTSLGFTMSYFDKIIGEKGVRSPDKKIFFNGDIHCVMHDPNILDMQEQFCQDYKPDMHVNIGDLMDGRAVNHHMGGTEGPAFYHNSDGCLTYGHVMKEIATIRWVVQRMKNWAKESHLIIGNHERFLLDFVARYPQLQELLDLEFVLDTKKLGIQVTNLKRTLDFNYVRFIHGDQKMFGGIGGSKVDKVANCYGNNTVMGNIHYSCIRSGCYSVGMSGRLNQDYNEVDASQWVHGFGYANVFDGKCFVTLITIIDNKFRINGKNYVPKTPELWNVPDYKANLAIEFGRSVGTANKNSPNKVRSPAKTAGKPVETSKTILRTNVWSKDKRARTTNKRA